MRNDYQIGDVQDPVAKNVSEFFQTKNFKDYLEVKRPLQSFQGFLMLDRFSIQ